LILTPLLCCLRLIITYHSSKRTGRFQNSRMPAGTAFCCPFFFSYPEIVWNWLKVDLVRFLVRSTLPFFIFSTLVKPGKVESKVFGKVDLTSLPSKEVRWGSPYQGLK
jgi:hypothetical protein